MGNSFHVESGVVLLLLGVAVLSLILGYIFFMTPAETTTTTSKVKNDSSSTSSVQAKTPSPRPDAGGTMKKRPVRKLND